MELEEENKQPKKKKKARVLTSNCHSHASFMPDHSKPRARALLWEQSSLQAAGLIFTTQLYRR